VRRLLTVRKKVTSCVRKRPSRLPCLQYIMQGQMCVASTLRLRWILQSRGVDVGSAFPSVALVHNMLLYDLCGQKVSDHLSLAWVCEQDMEKLVDDYCSGRQKSSPTVNTGRLILVVLSNDFDVSCGFGYSIADDTVK
jgi:hypothetical protein